jgi:hypothetical protein
MALSLFVVLANVFLIVGATRRRPHIVGPVSVLALAACVVLFCAVVWTVRPTFDSYATEPDGFFGSANWLYFFSGVAITSIAIQGLFAFRYFRYLVRSKAETEK